MKIGEENRILKIFSPIEVAIYSLLILSYPFLIITGAQYRFKYEDLISCPVRASLLTDILWISALYFLSRILLNKDKEFFKVFLQRDYYLFSFPIVIWYMIVTSKQFSIDWRYRGLVSWPNYPALLILIAGIYRYGKDKEKLLRELIRIIRLFSLFSASLILHFLWKANMPFFINSRFFMDIDFRIIDKFICLGKYPEYIIFTLFPPSSSLVQAIIRGVYVFLYGHMMLIFILFTITQDSYNRLRCIMVLSFILCFGTFCYYLFPTVGPIFAYSEVFRGYNEVFFTSYRYYKMVERFLLSTEGQLKMIGAVPYIAACPSLHIALEFAILYYTRYFKILFIINLFYFLAMAVATIFLGYHYVFDWVIGFIVAIIGICLVNITLDISS